MRTLSLALIGTSPLLLHRISRHQERDHIAASGAEGKSLEAEAENVMSKDEHGNPAVPVPWLWDALRAGCSRIIVKGRQASFFELQSLIHLPEGTLPLKNTDNQNPCWEVYSSIQHASPESKKSIVVVTPKFKDWMLELKVEVREEFLGEELLLKIFNEAGRAGIGLFHPPKKQFGQFKISS